MIMGEGLQPNSKMICPYLFFMLIKSASYAAAGEAHIEECHHS